MIKLPSKFQPGDRALYRLDTQSVPCKVVSVIFRESDHVVYEIHFTEAHGGMRMVHDENMLDPMD